MNEIPFKVKRKPPVRITIRPTYANFLGIGEGKRKQAKEAGETERLKLQLASDQTAAIAEINRQAAIAATIAQTTKDKAAAGTSSTTIMIYVGVGIVVLLGVMYFIKKKKK